MIAREGQLEFDFVDCEVIRPMDLMQTGPDVDFCILPQDLQDGLFLEIKDPARTPEQFQAVQIPHFIAEKLESGHFIEHKFRSGSLRTFEVMSVVHPNRETYSFIGLFGISGIEVYGFRAALQTLQTRILRYHRRHSAELPFISETLIVADLDWNRLFPKWPLSRTG